jgi:hypothetical protein
MLNICRKNDYNDVQKVQSTEIFFNITVLCTFGRDFELDFYKYQAALPLKNDKYLYSKKLWEMSDKQ